MRSTTAMPSRYAAALLSSINWGTDVDGASVVLTATGLSSNYDAFVVVFDQPTLSPRWSRMLKGTSNLFHEACVIAPSLAASRRDAQWPISMALIGVARNERYACAALGLHRYQGVAVDDYYSEIYAVGHFGSTIRVSRLGPGQLHPLHARWHAPLRLASSRCRPNELIGGGLCMQCADLPCRWRHGCMAARQSEPGLDLVGWWAVWLGLAWQVPADADAKYQLNIGLPEQKACLVKCVTLRHGTTLHCPCRTRTVASHTLRVLTADVPSAGTTSLVTRFGQRHSCRSWLSLRKPPPSP